ncbi:MAG: ParB/RepB/Spo0J family partition protein [Pontixanthobacter sp.]
MQPANNKRKLGRGLGALMGEIRKEEPFVSDNRTVSGKGATTPTDNDNGLMALPISAIEPLPGQPRTVFDEDALGELAASIASRGVIQPVIVTPRSGGKYRLVAGERRWRAAQKAQLHTIPAIVRTLDPQEVMAVALIENLQREDLNPIEEARAYRRLADSEDMTQADIAKLVDKSRSHVANMQRLLGLPDDVLDLVQADKLTMGHARALIGHDDASKLARKAVNDNLSVREIEKLARPADDSGEKRRRQARPSRDPAKDADIAAVQNHLEEFLGLAVAIKAEDDLRAGAVTIKYRTLDQLDLICQRLTGGDI